MIFNKQLIAVIYMMKWGLYSLKNNIYNPIESLIHNISISKTNKFKVVACKVIILNPDSPINEISDTVEVETNKIV